MCTVNKRNNIYMSNHKTITALSLLVLLGFIWGSGYTLAKYAMSNGVPPLGYAFWQSLGPAILLCVFSLFSSHKYIIHPKYWFFFLIAGLVGIAIPNTNMYFIASHIPAGVLAVIVNTVPLIVYPLALITRQEKIDYYRILAIILGMIGILLIIGVGISKLISYWAILALISPIGFALCSIYIGFKQPKEMNAIQAASGMLVGATLFLTPLVIYQGDFYSLTGDVSTVKLVILLEIMLSSLGYFLFFKLIQIAGPVFYSLTGGIVALTGLFWGYTIYGEVPNLVQGCAALLVIFAIFLLSWRQSNQHYGT